MQFYQDMGECPREYELDRIDNNREYEPGNVRWATCAENNQNRRNNKCTPEIVRAIRSEYPRLLQISLASKYGISQEMVSNIITMRAWKNIASI